MKAFLSHSSFDKGFVDGVARRLTPGTFELDDRTFDAGLLNSRAIIDALKRSDLFCLFLSKESAKSFYVHFETDLAVEFFAKGKIDRILIICLDEDAFDEASENARLFNIIRRGPDEDHAARLIEGYLITARSVSASVGHPFLGREEEMIELETQVTNVEHPNVKALFISGNTGSGRTSLARSFYRSHFPKVGQSFPKVTVNEFAGLEELYRTVIMTLRPSMKKADFLTHIQAFQLAPQQEKRRLIASQFNSLARGDQTAFIVDEGGLLADSGCIIPEVNEVLSCFEDWPHPPAVFITRRMIPKNLRRQPQDVAYLALKSFNRDVSSRLITKLLKDKGITCEKMDAERLIELSDGHPFNIYRMVSDIEVQGIKTFLSSTADFIDWKHRQSSEYLKKHSFSLEQTKILALLTFLPEIDFTSVCACLKIDSAQVSKVLITLTDLHIVESQSDLFKISPALRTAIERDRRLRLNPSLRKSAFKALASSLTVRIEEGIAPVALADAAIIASLETGTVSEFMVGLLLPSHYVWMARKRYDEKNWNEAIRFAKQALENPGRLSSTGFVEACRCLCLAASRLGDQSEFKVGINKLEKQAKDDWAKSNVAYLHGFNSRMKGSLPEAEDKFKEAYLLSPGNSSAARELASISLTRKNLDRAEQYAREAHSHAQGNPYTVDVLLAVLINKYGQNPKYRSEIDDLFDVLEKVGENDDQSFYTARRAEYELLRNNIVEAKRLINVATAKTPTIFEPRRLAAKIYLKDGNNTKAFEHITKMEAIVKSKHPSERNSNLRPYLEIHSKYLSEIGRFNDAKRIFNDAALFTEEERIAAVREIEIMEGFNAR